MDTANQFLSLALFIMLLSFFIILNAVSSFEETKSAPVLNSLSITFSGKDLQEALEPNIVESAAQSINEGDTLDQLKALFNAHITGAKTRKNRLGTTMHIRMPIQQFERSLSAPRSAQGSFLPTLASLIQTSDTKTIYRMDMVLNIPATPANAVSDAPEMLRKNLRKIALISKRIEENGVPKKLISSGLSQGEEDIIDIYFRRYEPFNPTGIDGITPSEAEGQ